MRMTVRRSSGAPKAKAAHYTDRYTESPKLRSRQHGGDLYKQSLLGRVRERRRSFVG